MFKIALAFALALSTGCASFSGGLLPKVDELPPSTFTPPSAKLNFTFRQFLNGSPVTLFRGSAEEALQKKLLKILGESGYFSSVTPDHADPDLTLNVDMKDDGRGSMGMAVITGLTLYLVPSFATENWVIDAKVSAKDGTTWDIHLEDFVTQWQQLFLFPVMPFALAPVVNARTQTNLFKTLALEFQKRGILEAVAVK